jgi:hypothetical protein
LVSTGEIYNVFNQQKELRNLYLFCWLLILSGTFGSNNFFRFFKEGLTLAKKLTSGLNNISKPVPEQTH